MIPSPLDADPNVPPPSKMKLCTCNLVLVMLFGITWNAEVQASFDAPQEPDSDVEWVG